MVLKNIQVARGLAASMVVLAHANLIIDKALFNGLLIIGWCGVDFFFVLSGFIIFLTSHSSLGRPESVPLYALKRFRRVYPIYWVYTSLTVILGVAMFAVTGKSLLAWADMSALGLIRTFLLLPTNVPANDMPVLPVAWTLSFEVMFYALFALALALKPRIVLAAALVWVLAIAARSAGVFGEPLPTTLLYLFTESRNLEFLLGCFAAWLVVSGRVPTRAGPALLTIGCALLAASWANAHAGFRWAHQIDFVQFGIPFFLIVLGVALSDRADQSESNAFGRVGVLLGDASYSIYLTHFITLTLVGIGLRAARLPGLASFMVATLAAFAVGLLAYRFVERPLIERMRVGSVRSGRFDWWLWARKCSLATVFIGLGSVITIGFAKRVPQRMVESIEAQRLIAAGAWPFAESVRIAQEVAAQRENRLVMLGDSLTEWGRWSGGVGNYTLVNQGIGGNTTADILQRLAAVERGGANLVMLMAGVNDIFQGVPRDITLRNYESIVTRLRSGGAEVVAVSVLPISKQNSRHADTNHKIAELNAQIQALAARQAIPYLDLTDEFSEPTDFALSKEFTVDSVHLSALAYAKWLMRINRFLEEQR